MGRSPKMKAQQKTWTDQTEQIKGKRHSCINEDELDDFLAREHLNIPKEITVDNNCLDYTSCRTDLHAGVGLD
eukprot:7676684-Heterocapsa_arctica.AAC.1